MNTSRHCWVFSACDSVPSTNIMTYLANMKTTYSLHWKTAGLPWRRSTRQSDADLSAAQTCRSPTSAPAPEHRTRPPYWPPPCAEDPASWTRDDGSSVTSAAGRRRHRRRCWAIYRSRWWGRRATGRWTTASRSEAQIWTCQCPNRLLLFLQRYRHDAKF